MAGGDAREGRPGREALAPSKAPSGAAVVRQGTAILVRGGLLVDGAGAPARRADLLVRDGLVAAIGDAIKAPEGALVFEAAGAVVAPGFVDAHSHDDAALLEPDGSVAKLSQGVTAVVVGNCGLSLAPWTPSAGRPLPPPPLNLLGGPERFSYGSFAAYLEALGSGGEADRAPGEGALPGAAGGSPRPRAAVLAGHSSLRAARVADLGGPARPDELKDMIRDLEEGLEAGLAGFSGGLAYPASIGAPASEAAALAKAAFSRGKVFALHIRNEYEGMWDALDEAFAMAREALGGSPEPGARLVLSHQKCAGPSNLGRAAELLEPGREGAARLLEDDALAPGRGHEVELRLRRGQRLEETEAVDRAGGAGQADEVARHRPIIPYTRRGRRRPAPMRARRATPRLPRPGSPASPRFRPIPRNRARTRRNASSR